MANDEPSDSLPPLRCIICRRSVRWLPTMVALVSALSGTASADGRSTNTGQRTDLSVPGGGRVVSRSLWRCRNPSCLVPHGAVLGRLTTDGGLVLDHEVEHFAVFLDSARVALTCPRCGATRDFRGTALYSSCRTATSRALGQPTRVIG